MQKATGNCSIIFLEDVGEMIVEVKIPEVKLFPIRISGWGLLLQFHQKLGIRE